MSFHGGKESTSNAGDMGSIPGSVRSSGGGMATHSRIPAWEVLWPEKPGKLQSMGSQGVRSDWATKHRAMNNSDSYSLAQYKYTKSLWSSWLSAITINYNFSLNVIVSNTMLKALLIGIWGIKYYLEFHFYISKKHIYFFLWEDGKWKSRLNDVSTILNPPATCRGCSE